MTATAAVVAYVAEHEDGVRAEEVAEALDLDAALAELRASADSDAARVPAARSAE